MELIELKFNSPFKKQREEEENYILLETHFLFGFRETFS